MEESVEYPTLRTTLKNAEIFTKYTETIYLIIFNNGNLIKTNFF